MSKRTRLLLKENNQKELEMKMKHEDMKVLTDMVVYIRSANISPYYQEVVRRDIGQMIIDGEHRGMTVKDVIGGDYRTFCDNVIAEIPEMSSKERMLSLVRTVLHSAVVLMVIWFAFAAIDQFTGSNSWPYFTITAGNVISGVLLIVAAFLIFNVVSKTSLSDNTSANWKVFFTTFIAFLICMCVNVFIEQSLFKLHALIAAAGIIILFVIYKVLDAKVD